MRVNKKKMYENICKNIFNWIWTRVQEWTRIQDPTCPVKKFTGHKPGPWKYHSISLYHLKKLFYQLYHTIL